MDFQSNSPSREIINDDLQSSKKTYFDKLLEQLGDFGRYQKWILFLICLPVICSGLHRMAVIATWRDASVGHRCRLPIEDENATFNTLPDGYDFYMTFPWDAEKGTYSPCLRLDVDFTNKSYFESHIPATKEVDCNGNYVFDSNTPTSSASLELDMMCGNWYRHELSFKLFRLGMIGPMIFGDLADRFGRRPIFLLCIFCQVTLGTLAGIVSNFAAFVIFRLIVLMTQYGIPLIGLIAALELVGPSKRPFVWLIWELSIVVGAVFSDIIYGLITHWKMLQIGVSAPGLLLLLYYWYFPESIRWLLSQGPDQRAKATDMLKNIAKENKVGISEDAYCELHSANEENNNRKGILAVFRHPRLAIRTIILFFCWFVIGMTEFALYQYQPYFGLIYNLLYEIAKVIAFICVKMSLDKFGRKRVLCGGMFAGGAALTIIYFCEHLMKYEDYQWVFIICALIGRTCSVATYGAAFIFSAECFPTTTRTAGVGTGLMFATLGVLAPSFLYLLADNWIPLLMLVIIGIIISWVLLSLGVPETFGQLPEFLDAEDKFEKKKYNSLVEDSMELDEKHSNIPL